MADIYKFVLTLLCCLAVSISAAFAKTVGDSNIILNALPKSGSTYLMHLLKTNLGYQRKNIYSFYDYQANTFQSNLQWFFKTKSTIAKEHFTAPLNIARQTTINFMAPLDIPKLKLYTSKIIIHVRDPRQALLSLTHHINADQNSAFVPAANRSWYNNLKFSQQIDWGIENLLPQLVSWIDNWLIYKTQEEHKPDGLQILVTTYDELITNEKALYQKILQFYAIANHQQQFISPIKNAQVRFRKGELNEWRSVYSSAQKQRIAAIVPVRILQTFNWTP
jgi:hypothetical protein